MRLKKITLNNFRCFEALEIELHPRLTVLVGTNGAGKTAVLDGIATALSPVLTYLSSANQRLVGRRIKDEDFRIETWGKKRGKESWGSADYVQLIAETVDGLIWDNWRPSAPDKEPRKKYGQAALKKHLQAINESYKSTSPFLTPVLAYYGARRGYIEVPERLRESKENYAYPAAALIGALDSMSNFKEMLKWFDLEEAAELRANRGAPQEELSFSPALDAVRTAIKTLLGGTYQNPYFNREHKFVVEPADGGAPLQVKQLSQGYQSMLALAMDFARRLALANSQMDFLRLETLEASIDEIKSLGWPFYESDKLPEAAPMIAPAIMLVDEIDLHLHPAWQQRVLNDLMRAFPATQFIVTTHSPQVLASVDAACIRQLRQTSDENGKLCINVENVTRQTRGVASSDLLAEIMGVDPIPDIPEARMVSEYHALIQQGLHEDSEGQALRTKLEAHFTANHPVIRECDRMIRLQAFKQKLPFIKGED
ncbi:MAG: AAA family ATPase [Betaproteobacteria bacterium]|jgi:predicted ATP-binding protein involved in virulence|nr:AAA family ATPase [Betaproteobacteria bacterium]MBK9784964.1 AAA family ATPase [Candidatus Dechloromonas phosphorivorans]